MYIHTHIYIYIYKLHSQHCGAPVVRTEAGGGATCTPDGRNDAYTKRNTQW